MEYDLFILGASARAAAETAARAGYRPRCADFFADQDLASLYPVERITPAQDSLERLAERLESLPSTPWFYTGGFENHADILERISRRHRLWGIYGEPLSQVRDPERLAEALRSAGLNHLPVQRGPDGLLQDGTWLVKPLRSSGGIGITPYTQGSAVDSLQKNRLHASLSDAPPCKGGVGGGSGDRPLIPKASGFPTNPDVLDIQDCLAASQPLYFQRRANGDPFSALFIAAPESTRLLGVTHQLVGNTRSPFLYRGNVGPVIVRVSAHEQLVRIGHCLSESFDLKGWFGVDYVDDGTSVWPVEVNPRYTASIEIHELAWRRAILPAHIHACGGPGDPLAVMPFSSERRPERIVGKRVLYATKAIKVDDLRWRKGHDQDVFAIRDIADIPAAGTPFDPGEPVLTVMATGIDVADCETQLSRKAEPWATRFGLE